MLYEKKVLWCCWVCVVGCVVHWACLFVDVACWGGLVRYDAALTRLRSWVQFPALVLLPFSFCSNPQHHPQQHTYPTLPPWHHLTCVLPVYVLPNPFTCVTPSYNITITHTCGQNNNHFPGPSTYANSHVLSTFYTTHHTILTTKEHTFTIHMFLYTALILWFDFIATYLI